MTSHTKFWLMVTIIFALAILLGGCDTMNNITGPPDTEINTNDPEVVVGPPSYAISSPDSLILSVGDTVNLPTVTVYDSTGAVISNAEVGWRMYNLEGLEVNLEMWTAEGIQQCEGTMYPVATVLPSGTYMYLGGKVTVKVQQTHTAP